jgi:3-deoxy-manno-octulosonate cytidylyltransferase (CMP-KDO synthetase)
MSVAIIIPARMKSARFPGKPLADLNGKPMIQWVVERAKKARDVSTVVVATDDDTIKKTIEDFGGTAVLTSPNAASGTDRVAEAAEQISADVIVNVQGDEPLIDPQVIERTIELVRYRRFPMATAVTPFRSAQDVQDPNLVKVVTNVMGSAIMFSRLPIPYSRQGVPEQGPWISRQHIGIYVYTREALMRLHSTKPVAMEFTEGLEQLRALAYGIDIGVVEVDYQSVGVDTPEDLERVKRIMREKK